MQIPMERTILVLEFYGMKILQKEYGMNFYYMYVGGHVVNPVENSKIVMMGQANVYQKK